MTKMQRKLPDFSYEKILHKKGFERVAGVDEVGRGCFAGPVVAGCVIFAGPVRSSSHSTSAWTAGAQWDPLRFCHPLSVVINDSKKLSSKQRELADKWIRKNALAWGIAEASVAQINKLGIKKATEVAFRKAIAKANPDYLLIDAFYIPYVKGLRRRNQLPIVHGDAKSVSIAAASIIAKVYRDKLMSKLSLEPKYKKYGWGRNKGYGTREHQKAIEKHGVTNMHRKLYIESWIKNSSSLQAL